MKIPLSATCWVCFQETDQSADAYKRIKAEDIFVEMTDEGIYQFTCYKGHDSFTVIQQEKFELLFDLGAMALLDGYSREAVSSLTAALENFCSFYIRVITSKFDVNAKELANTWCLVSPQSERQLGAFYFLYLINNKKAPPTIPNSAIKFRNDVIHKGYIATTNEVIKYGQILLEYIFNIMKEFRSENERLLNMAIIHQQISQRAKLPNQVPFAISSIPSIINLRSIKDKSFGNISFQEALDSIANNSFYKHYYKRQ
jgi:hypothetical protein